MNLRAGSALLIAAVALGCSANDDNPFNQLPGTQPPPADADLLFASSGPDSAPSNVHDVYAVDVETGTITRLTSCSVMTPLCDVIEVSPAPERDRLVVRRRVDTNDDGRVTDTDEMQVFSLDLTRAIEGRILGDLPNVTGVQWSDLDPGALLFSATGAGDIDDLYNALVDGTEAVAISTTVDQHEHNPRVETGILLFERGARDAITIVWGASADVDDVALTAGDPSLEPLPLPGTPYRVGSDANPDLSSARDGFVFRRLTGLGDDGRGTWSLLTRPLSSEDLAPLAEDAVFRSAPDWGAPGIAFIEADPTAASDNLVVLDPATKARRVLLTARAGSLLSPRWLR